MEQLVLTGIFTRINQVEINISPQQMKYCNSLRYCDFLVDNKIYLNEIALTFQRVKYFR